MIQTLAFVIAISLGGTSAHAMIGAACYNWLAEHSGFVPGAKTWFLERKDEALLPNLSALIRGSKMKYARNELGPRHPAMGAPALENFSRWVMAKFHVASTESIEYRENKYVAGGPSGGGRDAYTITYDNSLREGDVTLGRTFVIGGHQLLLRVKAKVSFGQHTIPRGYEESRAPDIHRYVEVSNRIEVDFEAPTMDDSTATMIENRFALAIDLARKTVGQRPYKFESYHHDGPYFIRFFSNGIGRLTTSHQYFDVSAYEKGPQAADFFLAGLIDLLSVSEQDFNYLRSRTPRYSQPTDYGQPYIIQNEN